MTDEQMTRFYITVRTPKDYSFIRYKGVHFQDPNHQVSKSLTKSLDLNLLQAKLSDLKKQREFEELDHVINKNKLKEIKFKLATDRIVPESQQTLRREISAKSFFISKRTVTGGLDSQNKSTATQSSTERYLKNTNGSKASFRLSDPNRNSQRLQKSFTSLSYLDTMSTVKKDQNKGLEDEKRNSNRSKREAVNKSVSLYKSIFSNMEVKARMDTAYRICSPKRLQA